MPASGNGTAGNIQGPFTDSTGTYYTVGGQKSYVSPSALHTGSAPGGGVFTNGGTWNTNTGKYDQGINWGNVLSMVVAGALTAGAATAMLGGSAEAANAVADTVATGEVPSQFAALPGALATEGGANGAAALVSPTLEGVSAGGEGGAGSTIVPETTGAVVNPTVATPDVELEAATGGPAGGGAVTPTTDGYLDPELSPTTGGPAGGSATTATTTGDVAGGGSSLKGVSDLISATGKGLGAAATANGNNTINAANAQVSANNSNNQGQLDFQNELMARQKAEVGERHTDLQNIYRQSYAANPSAHTSPYDPVGPPVYSATYLKALSDLAAQGSTALATPPQYGTTAQPPIAPPTTVNPANLQNPGGTLGTISNYLSPGLSAVGTIGKIAGWFQ